MANNFIFSVKTVKYGTAAVTGTMPTPLNPFPDRKTLSIK